MDWSGATPLRVCTAFLWCYFFSNVCLTMLATCRVCFPSDPCVVWLGPRLLSSNQPEQRPVTYNLDPHELYQQTSVMSNSMDGPIPRLLSISINTHFRQKRILGQLNPTHFFLFILKLFHLSQILKFIAIGAGWLEARRSFHMIAAISDHGGLLCYTNRPTVGILTCQLNVEHHIPGGHRVKHLSNFPFIVADLSC